MLLEIRSSIHQGTDRFTHLKTPVDEIFNHVIVNDILGAADVKYAVKCERLFFAEDNGRFPCGHPSTNVTHFRELAVQQWPYPAMERDYVIHIFMRPIYAWH